jgi:hypothetical protein
LQRRLSGGSHSGKFWRTGDLWPLPYNLICCFFTTHCSLRLIVRSELDVPTFATRRLHASPSESTQRRKVELWARNVR